MPKNRTVPDGERENEILKRLKKEFPEAKTALTFSNPFELLISTILSAQCTDVRVNKVTPALFAKYPTVKHFANAERHELEMDIKSTGFYHHKAKNIIGAAQTLVEKFGGIVPQTMEELLQLPGVGRKTANCVLGGAFGIQSGIVVDTHVLRLSKRLGLTTQNTPEKVEEDLLKMVPKKDWYRFSNLLILHGRKTCNARKPLCGQCCVAELCPSRMKEQ
ncbi:MAG TPA: endonuclease III [Bacteroidota bacterium]|nr:endonuclease III [Bacteroidota bacterium]